MGEVQPLVRSDPAGEGGGEDAPALAVLGRGGGFGVAVGRRVIRIRRTAAIARFGRFGLGCFGRFLGLRFLFFGRGGAVDGVGAFTFFQQHGDGRVYLHAVAAFFDQDFADGAFVDGFELHRGLVGLDLGEDVARGDLVPFLDQPLGERAFLHRGRKGGHENFCGHDPLLTGR